MFSIASIPLFPSYSLDTSILAAVLIGVVVLAFMTETLGWVFVGLVVPGYLASIFVIHPEAGATVTVEAILTYLLAIGLARGLSKTGAWSEFFGRERFFLVVLASVLVRAVSEAILLPQLGGYLDARFSTTFVLERSLHSIGLVLVPLTANAFWKLNLRRGLFQVGVPVAITYALLRWVLLPFTNLSFSSLELTYEDVAQNFLASPKAYILLVTTALIAARFNARYGWDFNGILVPALLAVTFVVPGKVVATLGEVLVLVVGTKALLALPGLRTLNLEGPRKTVLVFTLGFLLKWCVGWALGGRIPGLKVTDLFGFGYLVPTLLAVKILQKQVVARITLATLHTSIVGVAVGTAVGFLLSLIEPSSVVAAATPTAPTPGLGLSRSPIGVMVVARATVREQVDGDVALPRRRGELRRYEALWVALDRWLQTPSTEALERARRLSQPLGLFIEQLPITTDAGRTAYVLSEPERLAGKVGWDTALLFPGAPGPVLEVPRPATEAPSAEASVALCDRILCRAILVSGLDTHGAQQKTGDAVWERRTPLRSAHAVLSRTTRIVIRTDEALPRAAPVVHSQATEPLFEKLWPGAVAVPEAPPGVGSLWGPPNVLVFRAHPMDLTALVLEGRASHRPPSTLTVGQLLARGVREADEHGEPKPLEARPSDVELYVLEQQVAKTLLHADAVEGTERSAKLAWASRTAGLLGLDVRGVSGCGDGCHAVLDPDALRGRLGAALLVRWGGAPVAIEVPVPVAEAGTLPIALEMWRSSGARALVFAEPRPSGRPEPHPAMPGELRTAFQALHQAVHRSLPSASGVVFQVRGFSGRPAAGTDLLVDMDGPVLEDAQKPEPLERLFAKQGPLAWLGPIARYNDGSVELAGMADATPQQTFSRTFSGPPLATLWFSDRLRGSYASFRRIHEHLTLAGLASQAVAAGSPLSELMDVRAATVPPILARRFEALWSAARRYVDQRGIHDLRRLVSTAGNKDSVAVRHSAEHGLSYLLLESRRGQKAIRGVYFLHDHPTDPVRIKPTQRAELELAQALTERRPVVVQGELGGPKEAAR